MQTPIKNEIWHVLTPKKRRLYFSGLPKVEAEELFLKINPQEQYDLISELPSLEKRSWFRLLNPDDAADLVQKFPVDEQQEQLDLFDEDTKKDVIALMQYEQDNAGGLMTPHFIRLRPEMTVDVAIRYLRAQASRVEHTVHSAYVLDDSQKLLARVSFRQLILASPDKKITEIWNTNNVTLSEDMKQEDVARKFVQTGASELPVVDADGHIKGIITADDAIAVAQKEATDDIQRMGGTEALDEAYLKINFFKMLKKRAGWLTILFLGEMLTATAMGYFEKEIERAVVLSLFIPLIISSGGNSGSQATSLIIRSLALTEIKLKDWWRVLVREVGAGVCLGLLLGSIGMLRILLWPTRNETYGAHFVLIGTTVASSLIGVVLWGSVAGAMLPFILRKVGFDPAAASAPLVATLVDVTGLIIYFTIASFILHGTLL